MYDSWPVCQNATGGQLVSAPCKQASWGTYRDGSFDLVADMEYSWLDAWLNYWAPECIDYLSYALKGLVTGTWTGYAPVLAGGVNPVTYRWEDARGTHRVRVKVGKHKVPRIVKKKYGNWWKGKTCMELWYYSDEDARNRVGSDQCYVEVARFDRPSTQGLIGRWNPLNRGVAKRAYFSYGVTWNDVHLRDKI